MPGLVHAVDSYAATTATLRNVFLIGLVAAVVIIAIMIHKKKQK